MYIVPLIFILAIALAIFVSPIIALVLFVVFLAGLGAFKFLGPGTDDERAAAAPGSSAPPNAPDTAGAGSSGEEEGGLWGEKWPEQKADQESG
jgi:hypothetical protein